MWKTTWRHNVDNIRQKDIKYLLSPSQGLGIWLLLISVQICNADNQSILCSSVICFTTYPEESPWNWPAPSPRSQLQTLTPKTSHKVCHKKFKVFHVFISSQVTFPLKGMGIPRLAAKIVSFRPNLRRKKLKNRKWDRKCWYFGLCFVYTEKPYLRPMNRIPVMQSFIQSKVMLQDLANNIILVWSYWSKTQVQMLQIFKVTQREEYFCALSRLIFILQ